MDAFFFRSEGQGIVGEDEWAAVDVAGETQSRRACSNPQLGVVPARCERSHDIRQGLVGVAVVEGLAVRTECCHSEGVVVSGERCGLIHL